MRFSLYNFLLVHIDRLLKQIASTGEAKAFQRKLNDSKTKRLQVGGLKGSSAAMLFAGLASAKAQAAEQAEKSAEEGKKTVQTDRQAGIWLFILDDQDEAGYFYNDLLQMLGDEKVSFYPSSYRRAIKYNQKDPANEILRTEVLTRLQNRTEGEQLYVVSYPDAISEKVISEKELTDSTVPIRVGDTIGLDYLEKRLFDLGMQHTDYVYEPGQFAVRGSIVDIYKSEAKRS